MIWPLLAILLLHAACFQGRSPRRVKKVHFGQLKTTFNNDPSKGFNDEPRTRSEAEKAGFKLFASGCNGGSYPYPGEQLIQKYNNETGMGGEIILIFDVKGYIAGISSVIEIKSSCDPDPNSFKHPMYQMVPGINGTMNYVTTAYFIRPRRVCRGRSRKQFRREGTGTGLYLINGPTANNFVRIPLYKPDDKPNKKKKYYRGGCFRNMGIHYILHNQSDENSIQSDCSDAPPVQLRYDTQEPHRINGFTFQTPGLVPGKRWEVAPPAALKFIFGPTFPQCYTELLKAGARSMHVYIRDYNQTCPKPQGS